jgi:thiamine pyrophosphate-dependent acetolactate synthase large subunit-like protein
MGNTAIWTAAHYGIGCLMIVCNNRSFYTDEAHQRRLAETRGRPAANQWIGTRIDDPDVDIAQMAAALGAVGLGPVTEPADLQRVVEEGIEAARAGNVCVIDAWVARDHSERAPATARTRSRRTALVRGLTSRLRSKERPTPF